MCPLSLCGSAKGAIGTVGTFFYIRRATERYTGIEYLGNCFVYGFSKRVAIFRDVGHLLFLIYNRRVEILTGGMLYVE